VDVADVDGEGRAVCGQAADQAGQRLVVVLAGDLALDQEGVDHAAIPAGELALVVVPAQAEGGGDAGPEEQAQPQHAAGDGPPGALPDEVGQEQGGGDLAGDGQGEQAPGQQVAAGPVGRQEGDDEEEDEQVDVAVGEVVDDRLEGEEGGQDLR